MGKIIAIANQKGGVGKTTLAIHCAAWLAAQKRRIILIDADTQANASTWILGQMPASSGLYDLLVRERALGQTLTAVNGRWGLGLIAGGLATADAMTVLVTLRKPFDTVANVIRPLGRAADYVLIDMPPSRAAGFQELLYAADLVLIPTQLERHSLEGVVFMAQACTELARQHHRGPRLLGIVPNMRRRNTLLHKRQHGQLVKTFQSLVWPSIPESIAIADAASTGRTVFEAAPGHPVAKALALIAQRIEENANV